MPESRNPSRHSNDLASFHAAIDETFTHGAKVIEEIRARRLDHARTVASLAVERRVLRDDYSHWKDELA